MNTTPEKSAEEMTDAEFEAYAAERRKKKKAKAEREKKAYVAQRDKTVSELLQEAMTIHQQLETFKAKCHSDMEDQAIRLSDYGGLRSNSKGGFSITDESGTLRVTRRRDVEPHWDERADKGVELVREFLKTTVKKIHTTTYNLLMEVITKNEKGDLQYSDVAKFWKYENDFDDPRWKEGLKLIKESYTVHLKGFGYEFKTRGTDGKWKPINLTFASV